jgi:thiosulfate/3-mercaptopyruvate sulfurtransferase
VVVDFARGTNAFSAAHIPGAREIAIEEVFVDTPTRHAALRPVDEIAGALGAAGITNAATVVVYDDEQSLWACRLFLVMKAVGHEDVRVLDGGWQGWIEKGLPTQEGRHGVDPVAYHVVQSSSIIVDTDWLVSHIGEPLTRIIDVRSPAEFSGDDRRAMRAGHVPGARNLEWIHNLDSRGFFKSPDALRSLYGDILGDEEGRTPDNADPPAAGTAVTYCQSGVRAANTFFVLELLGVEDARIYLDSWQVWGNRPDTPVET